jgi:adenylate kinase family enzyme
MTEIRLIFRFSISEIVFQPIEKAIVSDKRINIISSDRIRNEFLKGESTIAKEINNFINEGKLIPTEYWCPFWTALITEGQLNIFTSLIGNIEQFKLFEKCIENKKYKLTEIVYLKLIEIDKLTDLAKQKYGKIYDDSEVLRKHIEGYQKMRDEIILYAENKYRIINKDFFETEIRI